ncbi:ELMO/CED-12 family-domain-containing protein [Phakopsora pachyrhizi]|uniref:ELMO/CED-12 family-domain-containing protein n=1 Tax=Phakopsora pachyrhizi TaxID=170000 RepID=A0AAV0BEK0_PHAPC|nr:ELMO/CED-12 family-domain-containing protein [Phakopsora pachyrhizi]
MGPSPSSTDSLPPVSYLPPSQFSIWRLFLFHFALPSVSDCWRLFLSTQTSTTFAPVFRAAHQSFKLLYRCLAWLALFPYQMGSSSPTSELQRALRDVRNHQRTPTLTQSYRDDQDDELSTSIRKDSRYPPVESYEASLAVWRVDWVLQRSNRLQTVKVVSKITEFEVEEIVSVVLAVKRVNNLLAPTLTECLRRIQMAAQMKQIVEERSKTSYDPDLHQKNLLEIGFQGTDPATDFRGAGLLGLDAMLVFARYYGKEAQSLVSEAVDGGPSWYPWALASINITWWCQSLIQEGRLQFFLLSCNGLAEELLEQLPNQLNQFLFLQIRLTYLFHCYWRRLDPSPTVMEFEERFKAFKAGVAKGLMKGLVGGLGVGWIFEYGDRPKKFLP